MPDSQLLSWPQGIHHSISLVTVVNVPVVRGHLGLSVSVWSKPQTHTYKGKCSLWNSTSTPTMQQTPHTVTFSPLNKPALYFVKFI
jgi:hypothetical protein